MRGSTNILTPRQAEILRFIIGHVNEFGYAPTMKEIIQFMGATSKNSALQVASVLARKGYLRLEPVAGAPSCHSKMSAGWR